MKLLIHQNFDLYDKFIHIKIIVLMYNFFKYQQTVRAQQAQRRQEEHYSQWLLKNQDIKQQAKSKEKAKLDLWVQNQLQNPKPTHLEDDHYKQWRFLKQFRDVEHQPAFLGYKTFRHKPSNEMNKYFNERQRKQIESLGKRKQHLIDSSLIHEYERGRSLRSQGPLNPKIQFRSKKKDSEYLNPKLKFKHVTDKERLTESKMPMDDKFKSVYSSFEMKKSKIGVPRFSFYDGDMKSNRSRSSYDRYDLGTEKSYKLQDSGLNNVARGDEFNKINFNLPLGNSQNNEENLAESKILSPSKALTARMPEIPLKQPRVKSYWKLAKTMEVQENDQKMRQFLVNGQYNRSKDLSNLKMNMTCENFKKRPIL